MDRKTIALVSVVFLWAVVLLKGFLGGKAKEGDKNPVPSPEKDDEAEVIKKQIIREMASNAGKKSGAVRRARSKKAQPDEQPA